MSITTTAPTNTGADAPVLLAVSYLRVSTREQAERGGTEEGFSIPAQREANTRKAAELGARVVREFLTRASPLAPPTATGSRRCSRSLRRRG